MLNTTHPAEFPVYPRWSIRPARAEGCLLWDEDGREYLDMYGGHAVTAVGHNHPRVMQAIREQAGELLFYSNVVPLAVRERLFEALAAEAPSDLGSAFLVNSGAEANEQALALARRLTGRAKIVSVEGGFHGRTVQTLAAAGTEKYRELARIGGAGDALVEATTVVPFDDVDALRTAVDGNTAAVLFEPVQGLAGARALSPEFLRAARERCHDTGALLVFDEVQCGCGRVGAFTAAQAYDVTPDLLTLAKALGSGLPIGALLAGPCIVETLKNGDLGSTFGGGPVPAAAAVATLGILVDEALPARALTTEQDLRTRLAPLAGVERIVGKGLLLGLELDRPAAPVLAALRAEGVLAGGAAAPRTLRLLPPLTLEESHVTRFATALETALAATTSEVGA